jgi:glycosyltransferase involved in cell wall biosynthesis
LNKANVSTKRVLVIHRYYWPDKPPCASIMRWIAAHFASEGHTVEVLTSQPSYRSTSAEKPFPKVGIVDGVKVHRLNLPTETGSSIVRIINALHLGFWILLKALTRRYDVIVVTSIPPVLGGFFAAMASLLVKARLVYYVMDLHPEIGRVSGDFSNPVLFNTLKVLDSWTCRIADVVLVHSEDMRQTLRERPRSERMNIHILNNFAIPADVSSSEPSHFNLDTSVNRLTIVYAGNVGRFQNLETIVDAMGRIRDHAGIELIIMGDGVAKKSLVDQVSLQRANVRFIDFQPLEIAKDIIKQADIGLITLMPEIYKYAFPSKTMAYLEQGRPLIAMVELESELAKSMSEWDYGFAVPVGDVEALASLLIRLASEATWKQRMSDSAVKAFRMNYSHDVVLSRWSDVIFRLWEISDQN